MGIPGLQRGLQPYGVLRAVSKEQRHREAAVVVDVGAEVVAIVAIPGRVLVVDVRVRLMFVGLGLRSYEVRRGAGR